MEKEKTKENVKYVEKLLPDAKKRYLKKLEEVNGTDPYDIEGKEFSSNPESLPPLTYIDIANYLVFGISAYTMQQFKAYKSLEAHMQFTNGWVHDLQILKPAGCDSTVVLAKVMHSQRLGELPLKAWVILSSGGEVKAAHCTCMAGIAETCTHVGALLFKAEATVRCRERTTVTGVAAYWVIPSNVDKVQAQVGYKIDYSSAAAQKKALDNVIDGESENGPGLRTCQHRTSTPAATEEDVAALFAALHVTGDRAAILKVLPTFCEEFRDQVEPVTLPRSLSQVRDSRLDAIDLPTLLRHCEDIKPNAYVSTEQAAKLERHTREQANSPAWFLARCGRITASNLHAAMHTNLEKPALSVLAKICQPQNSKKSKSTAMQWGADHEDQARKDYTVRQSVEHFGLKVDRCGFFVNPKYPFLGASPDGLVQCACCGRGCLEVKCPHKHRGSSFAQACTDKDFCLETSKQGEFFLKHSHPFYSQVQAQIFITGVEFCDLCVWLGPKNTAIVRVLPDSDFWQECVQKAERFFVHAVLPELAAHYFTRSKSSLNPAAKKTSTQSKENASPSLLPRSGSVDQRVKRPLSVSPKKKMQPARKRDKKCTQPLWCYCRRGEYFDNMVQCDNKNCDILWYHLTCVSLTHLPAEDEVWFCPSCIPDRH